MPFSPINTLTLTEPYTSCCIINHYLFHRFHRFHWRYSKMSSLITINEDLYVRARRLYQWLHSQTGAGPEYAAVWDRWVDFRADHPLIADEVSMSYGSPAIVFGALELHLDHPWDEAAEYQKSIDKSYWSSFLMGCPLGAGFRAEINALVTFLRGRSARLSRNNSKYGKSF